MRLFLVSAAGLFFLCFLTPFSYAQAQEACTEIGCVDGLTIDVPPSVKWEPGKYNFVFALDNKVVTCAGELPLEPCEKGPTMKCTAPGVQIMESGCALPREAQSYGSIQVSDAPKKVMVRITRNDKPLYTRTYYPTYQTSTPNGPKCGPVCHAARVDLIEKK